MSNTLSLSAQEIDHLLSPKAIREKATAIFALCREGGTAFVYHPEKLKPTVDYVLEVIRDKYPDLKIPFHSRWGHFRAGGIDRVKEFDQLTAKMDSRERSRCKLDLVI